MTGDELRTLLDRAFEILAGSEDELRDLDAAVGDGDLGITVSRGSAAAREAMRSLPATATPAEVLRSLASAISAASPSSFGALVASGLLAASRSVAGSQSLSRDGVVTIAQQAAAAVEKRGKSALGDKTVLDALIPSVRALEGELRRRARGDDRGGAKGIDETTRERVTPWSRGLAWGTSAGASRSWCGGLPQIPRGAGGRWIALVDR